MRVGAALLCAAIASSLFIAGSSASVTPTPRKSASAASLKPVPVGTKVKTVSAKSATAKQNARAHVRGGHAATLKINATRIYKGVGSKNSTKVKPGSSGEDQIMLAPPAAPSATAGTNMPAIFGSGSPILAGAPLAPASNRLSPVDMRVLVIAADGNETDLGAVKAALDNVGIPYTVLIAATTDLTSAMLWDGVDHGYYQGVIMTTNSLTYSPDGGTTWQSAFTDAEFQTLWAYESSFNVRQVTSYTAAFGWPETLGLSSPTSVDTTTTPITAQLTTAGRGVFNYLNTAINLPIANAWVYRSTITEPTTTTALLTSGGYPIASVHTSPDGRQNLAITAANGFYLKHSQVLAYGIVNWVTKGLFLGKKRIAITPQVDDLFIDNNQWNVATHSETGQIYRNTSADWQAIVNWQASTRASSPQLAAIRLEWPFNGEGTTGIYRPDTLSAYVYTHQSTFSFVSHTWSHQSMDFASNNDTGPPPTAAQIRDELTRNDTFANQRRLTGYFKDSMVQPDISGLTTPIAQQTAYAWGIRYWISDTSRVGWNNPSPNVGFWAPAEPRLLVIPRRPTNIFYNVSTPAMVVDEYNYFYAPGGIFPYWPSPRTYEQIIDIEAENVLAYMLQGDNDPLMFHISNVRAYSGQRSVLGDLLTSVLTKYRALYNLPVASPSQHQLGLNMTQWMAYKTSGVAAVLRPCSSIQMTVTKAAAVPVTGVTFGASGDTYNGQRTSNVTVNPGQTVTVPLPTTGC